VRLTAELIITSPAFVNTLKERELDLRGNKISQIENLGATEDQYDVLDFSDNDITRLEGFPLLNRLSTLLLSNNRITTFATGLGPKIPNLESLILTSNRVENLADLDPLSELKKLQNLSLLRNPVTKHKHYRLYIIFKLPSVKVLDFQKVKSKERAEAAKLFDNEAGAQLVSTISQMKAVPTTSVTVPALTEEQKQKIQEMIGKASTSEEIQRLDRALRSGKVPKSLEKAFAVNENVPIDEEQELDEGLSIELVQNQETNAEEQNTNETTTTTTVTKEDQNENGADKTEHEQNRDIEIVV